MAKFSKGQYVVLENALLRAKARLLQAEEGEGLLGLFWATEEIAKALAADNRKFNREQFFDVIRGDKPIPVSK